jgi:hypothetical protein
MAPKVVGLVLTGKIHRQERIGEMILQKALNLAGQGRKTPPAGF